MAKRVKCDCGVVWTLSRDGVHMVSLTGPIVSVPLTDGKALCPFPNVRGGEDEIFLTT
ncbi:MAG: hypothetical protein JW384_03844 [Nitrosomonadaceae bacterium]|nr:hypothetical protein [Nitrosomonadaceae bacterium]